MKKKGFFYSLGAILFVAFLAFAFYFEVEKRKANDEMINEEIQLKITEDFIKSLDEYFFKNALVVSSKYAFEQISLNAPVPVGTLPTELANLVNTGTSTCCTITQTVPSNVDNFQRALNIPLNRTRLDITVVDIEQPNEFTIETTYNIDFEFESNESKWSDIWTKKVNVTIYGMEDPTSSLTINKQFWQVDGSSPNCFINRLDTAEGCGFVRGIMEIP